MPFDSRVKTVFLNHRLLQMETSTKQGNVSCKKKKKKIPPSLPPLKTKNQKTEHKDPLGVVRLLGGMLLVKMGKGAGMQEYKGETVGRRQPSLLGCRNATERRGEGMRSETERGWSRWWSGRGGGVFYLKVDSLYTGGWMGDELRGRKGGRQSNRGGGEGGILQVKEGHGSKKALQWKPTRFLF